MRKADFGGVLAALVMAVGVFVPAGTVAAETGKKLLGVYKGAGCDGLKGREVFAKWLGREPDIMLEFLSWKVVSRGTTWGVGCWKKGGQKAVVYSMPMLPPDNSATLAEGAAGKFDEYFRRYGEILVQFGFAEAIVRIGWEFNGEWYSWAASKDPQSYIEYWRRIVRTMRAVPGSNFKFDWCMAGGWTNFLAENAYPGDDYVDIIGIDFYNVPIDPKAVTPQQRWESRLNTRRGLQWHRDFAIAHGKPISIPEWGTGLKPDGKGGGDDPYFIKQMAAWIANNNVAYHVYWDQITGVNARLSDGHQPLAGAAYQRAFGKRPKPPVLNRAGLDRTGE